MSIQLVAVSAYLALLSPSDTANQIKTADPFVEALKVAIQQAQDENCSEAMASLVPATEDNRFKRLPANSRADIYSALADCSLNEQNWSDALLYVNKLIDLRGETENLLWHKLHLGDLGGKPLDSLEAAKKLAQRAQQSLNEIDIRVVWRIANSLEVTLLGDKRREFVGVLFDAGYTSPDPTVDLDGLRIFYARLMRDEAMSAGAAIVIREIKNPLMLAPIFYDRRYDTALKNFRNMPKVEDIPSMVEQYVSNRRSIMEENPDRLSAALTYIQALKMSGDFDGAYRAATDVVDMMGDDAVSSPYTDYAEFSNWVLNELSYLLYDVGRPTEARQTLEAAAALQENGGDNVSQIINLSLLLVGEGKFDDALQTISSLNYDNASSYGVMWAKSTEVCARALSIPATEFSEQLNYLRTHRDKNASALSRALLCVNNIDEAAEVYIERLNDLDERDDALSGLQIVIDTPNMLPVSKILQQRFDIIRQRADVKAAANDVGRILQLPIYPTNWGDF